MEFAKHVMQSLAINGVGNAHYWGTHTGAGIGLLLATHNPHLFDSMILEKSGDTRKQPSNSGKNVYAGKELAFTESPKAAIRAWWEESCWFEYMHQNPSSARAEEQWEIVRDFRLSLG